MGVTYNPVLNSLNSPSITQNVIANIPPAGKYGRWFHGTDDNVLYWDNGSHWVAMTSGGGGGNVNTVGGTPNTLAMFTGPTDIGDSPMSFNPAGPLDHLLSTKTIRLVAGTDISFVKLLNKTGINQVMAAFNLSPIAVPYKLVVTDNGTSYDSVQSVFVVPLVHFRSDVADATIRLEQNGLNGLIEHLATLVRVSGKFKTGPPGSGGAGEIKIGKFTPGPAPIGTVNGYVLIELDNKLTYLTASQLP